MRLAPGARLGSYEILGELGAGGMGEVYRARDTTLNRDVALKLVNASSSLDPDSLSRFRREARALAALSHPHVAVVHEFAEFDDVCCIVMELVPGETLSSLIAHGPMSIAEVVRIGKQIAAALEAAHERGVVHRDLKPDNIRITPDGVVKVLDFGLAKNEAGGDAGGVITQATFHTEDGVVLGTASYMSPEQARGRPVDRRSDLWSFGCVLFEMLTGQRAFAGQSTSHTFVAILDRDPDWTLLPPGTPDALRKLLHRCLQKDVRNRLRDAGDARLELEDDAVVQAPAVSSTPSKAGFGSWPRMAALVAVGVAAGAAFTSAILRQQAAAPAQPVHFAVTIPSGERLGGLDFPALAISPDGQFVAYVVERGGRTQLALRAMGGLEAMLIAGTANAISPFFSPDSRWLAFFADGSLKKVAVSGGPPAVICEADTGFGGSWGADGTIVFASTTGSPLSSVPAAGGTPARLTKLDPARGEFSHRWPEWLPGGAAVIFTVGTVGSWDEAEVAAQEVVTGRRVTLFKGGTHPHYLPSGQLLYAHENAIWLVPFDPKQLALTGQPRRVLDGVRVSADGAVQFSVSGTDTAVYAPRSPDAGRRLVSVESGVVTPFAAPPRHYAWPRVSPDGRTLLVMIPDDTEQLYAYDIGSGSLKQVTFESSNPAAVWHPDGRVTFSSNRNGQLNLFIAALDGAGAPERLTTSDNLQLPGSWSPDGSALAFVEQRPGNGRDIWMLPRGGSAYSWLATPFDESSPAFSPDGRWLAYVSNRSGRSEVYVRATSGSPVELPISSGGGTEPVWARDGRSLFYRNENRLVKAALSGGTAVGAAQVVFAGDSERGSFDTANYDVMPGSDRLVVVTGGGTEPLPTTLHVVLNWRPGV